LEKKHNKTKIGIEKKVRSRTKCVEENKEEDKSGRREIIIRK
jgi:hypothetical protein